jgi:chloramphenicol-sensitive protein RarD
VSESEARKGLWAGIGAYGLWGVLALYWKLLDHVAPSEILAHRVFWCFLFSLVVLRARGTLQPLVDVLRDRKARRAVGLATLLIGANWFLFIWAVAERRVTEVSLGYYMNPILNVVLGAVFLGERLSGLRRVAVAFAAFGVVAFTIGLGYLPWLSLVLAGTFGFYGLVRKTAAAGPLVGLVIETMFLSPLAVVYVLVVPDEPGGALLQDGWGTVALLLFAGPITAAPLLLFATAARRLPYSTLGMLQYIAPTLQLACAVWAFGEPFTARHAVTFALVWLGVGLYAWSSRPRGTSSRPPT